MARRLKFTDNLVLPPGNYPMTIAQLRASILVTGKGIKCPDWDRKERLRLVNNLDALATQLWDAGITTIFIDGSFVECNDTPGDIDGYFEVPEREFVGLAARLNRLGPFRRWTWSPTDKTTGPGTNDPKFPMWHQCQVELFPHWPGQGPCGIPDASGNPLEFPAAFRQQRGTFVAKGIVLLLPPKVHRVKR